MRIRSRLPPPRSPPLWKIASHPNSIFQFALAALIFVFILPSCICQNFLYIASFQPWMWVPHLIFAELDRLMHFPERLCCDHEVAVNPSFIIFVFFTLGAFFYSPLRPIFTPLLQVTVPLPSTPGDGHTRIGQPAIGNARDTPLLTGALLVRRAIYSDFISNICSLYFCLSSWIYLDAFTNQILGHIFFHHFWYFFLHMKHSKISHDSIRLRRLLKHDIFIFETFIFDLPRFSRWFILQKNK